jgi:hypothetical protein
MQTRQTARDAPVGRAGTSVVFTDAGVIISLWLNAEGST